MWHRCSGAVGLPPPHPTDAVPRVEENLTGRGGLRGPDSHRARIPPRAESAPPRRLDPETSSPGPLDMTRASPPLKGSRRSRLDLVRPHCQRADPPRTDCTRPGATAADALGRLESARVAGFLRPAVLSPTSLVADRSKSYRRRSRIGITSPRPVTPFGWRRHRRRELSYQALRGRQHPAEKSWRKVR